MWRSAHERLDFGYSLGGTLTHKSKLCNLHRVSSDFRTLSDSYTHASGHLVWSSTQVFLFIQGFVIGERQPVSVSCEMKVNDPALFVTDPFRKGPPNRERPPTVCPNL